MTRTQSGTTGGRGVSPLIVAALVAFLTFASGSRAQTSASIDEPWLEALTFQLSDHFLPEGQLTLEWARPRPAEAALPAELSIVNFPSTLSPQLLLRVRTATATGPAEHTLVIRAQLWRDGWAAREPANRGEAVIRQSLETQRFDALRDRDAVAAAEDLDLIYARNIPNGRLLTWRDVARRPLVRRGQLIEVAATDGPLTVTLRAVALADAGRGEVVRVRNPDSRKEFSAQVVAEARALVRF
jgi:flagellar basal body P-ring formation protein FlgA